MHFITLDEVTVIHMHDEIIEHLGGLGGLAADKSLSGALSRIDNYIIYDGIDNLFLIAAMYGIALAKGHVFNDGNKRTALMVMSNFLELNGYVLHPDHEDATETMVNVAKDQISHDELAQWLDKNSLLESQHIEGIE